jgi:hypothetical protein
LTIAAVYRVTSDDHLDDPAWGIEPIMTGPPAEVASWLLMQADLCVLAISDGSPGTVWAVDFLRAMA